VFRYVLILFSTVVAFAADRWIEIRSGPFEVLSSAGDRPARDVLNQVEQVRYLLGANLGKDDLKSVWPFRIVIAKDLAPSIPTLARDAYIAAVPGSGAIPPAWMRECVRLLIEANAARMPASIESGIEDLYSTAAAAGTKVTLGAPPPGAAHNADWARIQLLVTAPEYAGRLRVLLYNLQRGADLDPAFRNAFSKPVAEIDRAAAAKLAAGDFPTVTVGGRPLNPQRDFLVKNVEGPGPALALADLRLVSGRDPEPAYLSLLPAAPAGAHEGLGLAALAARRKDGAREHFAAAVAAASTSARAWLESARLEPEPTKARPLLEKAAALNPNWAEPYVLLAAIETDPSRKLQWLKTAASLSPRNSSRWTAVAELYQKHDKYPEAAKAWAAAELASVDDAERQRIRDARSTIEEQRLAFEDAERKRRDDERQRDIQRVKNAAMAEVRAAEERANKAQPRLNPNSKVVEMDIGQAPPGKVHGRLIQVDCIGRTARLVVESGGSRTRLLVRDPRQVVVLSGGDLHLGCGAQRPVRTVTIEYFPKPDPKLASAGEVATVTYE